jgi:response regulator NasT
MPNTSTVRVLIVDARTQHTAKLERALVETGFVVLGVVHEDEDIHSRVRLLQPDAIIIDADSPSRDTLEGLAAITQTLPRPIVMLSDSDDNQLLRDAMQLGISAYVVDDVPPSMLRSLIHISMMHFRGQRLLLAELQQAQQQNEEQRLIHNAKCLLMEREQRSESDAYHWMRRRAMTRSQKLVDVARVVIQSLGSAPAMKLMA